MVFTEVKRQNYQIYLNKNEYIILDLYLKKKWKYESQKIYVLFALTLICMGKGGKFIPAPPFTHTHTHTHTPVDFPLTT